MIPMVAPQVFKELVGKRGGARTIKRADLPLVGLRKAELGDVERVDDRTLRFCISTGCIDRDLDRINQAGWALDHCPVVDAIRRAVPVEVEVEGGVEARTP